MTRSKVEHGGSGSWRQQAQAPRNGFRRSEPLVSAPPRPLRFIAHHAGARLIAKHTRHRDSQIKYLALLLYSRHNAPPSEMEGAQDLNKAAGTHYGLAVAKDGADKEQVREKQKETATEGCSDTMSTSMLPQSVASVLWKITKWKDYANYGNPVGESRVIPMKTPLTLELQGAHFPPATSSSPSHTPNTEVTGSGEISSKPEADFQVHTIQKFVQEQAILGRTIGLVVDLSNHECLYEEDLKRDCPHVSYEHFLFAAKNIPDRKGCRDVGRCITGYLAGNPEHYVAIHCSYGWNRTGYICAAYLVEELRYTASDALAAFAQARPPGIKHEHFLSEFLARYTEKTEKPPRQEGERTKSASSVAETARGQREINIETLGPSLGQKVLLALDEASRE